jgi:hypothetical protein
MTIQSIKQLLIGKARHSVRAVKPWLVSAAVFLTVAGVFFARTAFAKLAANTIDPVGIVADQGRHLTLTGPVRADAGDSIELRVTVTQRSTGAVAEGHTFLTGSDTTIQWEVELRTHGGATFEAGPATAVALARTTVAGKATDVHQWLVNVTLVQE